MAHVSSLLQAAARRADDGPMEDQPDIEAWADAFLEQHRTRSLRVRAGLSAGEAAAVPPRRPETGAGDIEPWADQVLDAHRTGPKGGMDALDGWWAEKQAKAAARQRTFAGLEAAAVLLGLLLLGIFVLAFLSNF